MVRNETVLLGLNQLTNWGILTTDGGLDVTGWNRWLEVSSGQSAQEVVGRNLLELFPDLVTRRLAPFFRQALAGQVVVLSQRLHKYLLPIPPSVDGVRFRHMQQSVRIAPLVEDDRIVGTLTVIEDVTERVVYDAELAAQARQQEAIALMGQRALAGGDLDEFSKETVSAVADILGVAYCAIWEPLPDGQGMRMRAGAGWKEAEAGQASLAGGPASSAALALADARPVVIPDLGIETRFAVPDFLKAHGVVGGASVPVTDGRGAAGVLAVYATRPHEFSDDSVHFLQAAANVLGLAGERQRLEQELRERARQLTEADRRKDEFLAMLAHELRNPLAPIRNAVGIYRLHAPADEKLQYARDVIDRQLQQMTRLIDDLLDVSRITRGKVDLQTEPVELATVVSRAVEISRPLIDSRKHQLTVTVPPAGLLVEADLARLSQVVANLLNNGAKYTEEGGRIALGATRSGSEVVLSVRDTGVGIAPGMLSSIFDLFTQVQGSVSRSEGGLGIGLSLVRSLVEMHGGRVVALSEGLGRGSEFVVRLPLLPQPAAPAAKAEDPSKSRKSPPKRILIVDDNEDAADSLAVLLELQGHEVRVAHDSFLALEIARQHPPDVVLLDIGLPVMNGLEVARRIRGDLGLGDALLVALTGYGQDEDRQRTHEAGFDAHLVKPLDFDALQVMLARAASDARGVRD